MASNKQRTVKYVKKSQHLRMKKLIKSKKDRKYN